MSDIYIHEYKGDTRKLIFDGLVKETENESKKSLTISLLNDSSSKVSDKNYSWSVSSNKGTVARLNWINNTLVEESEDDSYYIQFYNSSTGSTTTTRRMQLYVGPESCGLDFNMRTPLGQIRAQLSATRLAMSDPNINSSYLSSTALTMYAANQLCAEFSATGTTIPFIHGQVEDTNSLESLLPNFVTVATEKKGTTFDKYIGLYNQSMFQANVILLYTTDRQTWGGGTLPEWQWQCALQQYSKTNKTWKLEGNSLYLLIPVTTSDPSTADKDIDGCGWVPLKLSESIGTWPVAT